MSIEAHVGFHVNVCWLIMHDQPEEACRAIKTHLVFGSACTSYVDVQICALMPSCNHPAV